jgi:C-terminal processing protease CtpA/Prc
LAKGKRFADPDRGQMTGMHYLFKPKGIELEVVDEGSPAGIAGVHVKDILAALNGKPVSKLKPGAIHRLLNEEGKPVRVTVERAGKRMDFSFTPKEYD